VLVNQNIKPRTTKIPKRAKEMAIMFRNTQKKLNFFFMCLNSIYMRTSTSGSSSDIYTDSPLEIKLAINKHLDPRSIINLGRTNRLNWVDSQVALKDQSVQQQKKLSDIVGTKSLPDALNKALKYLEDGGDPDIIINNFGYECPVANWVFCVISKCDINRYFPENIRLLTRCLSRQNVNADCIFRSRVKISNRLLKLAIEHMSYCIRSGKLQEESALEDYINRMLKLGANVHHKDESKLEAMWYNISVSVFGKLDKYGANVFKRNQKGQNLIEHFVEMWLDDKLNMRYLTRYLKYLESLFKRGLGHDMPKQALDMMIRQKSETASNKEKQLLKHHMSYLRTVFNKYLSG
jgi:hypothetical protein